MSGARHAGRVHHSAQPAALVGAATLHHLGWFYPALLIVVGAHYLPFVFLYGMWTFALLAGLMITGGVWIGMTMPGALSLGGWYGAVLLLVFAVLGLVMSRGEQRTTAATAATAAPRADASFPLRAPGGRVAVAEPHGRPRCAPGNPAEIS